MKNFNLVFSKRIFCGCLIVLFQLSHLTEIHAQDTGNHANIAKYRKGELIIKAKPGDQVGVEQLSHEFWFGAAISNNFIETGCAHRGDRGTGPFARGIL